MTKAQEAKKKHATALMKLPNVVGVASGFKYRGGKRTDEECVVVYVSKKVDRALLAFSDTIPGKVDLVQTDVIEVGEIRGPRPIPHAVAPGTPLTATPLELTHRERPSRCGNSLGHFKITAGTQGAVVRLARDGELYVVTNNHVGADSNRGAIGDPILQPGPYDGGQVTDRVATLSDYVKINFQGAKKKNNALTRAWWKLFQAPANFGAALVGCPFRLALRKALPQGVIEQPDPNLVDVGLGKATDPVIVSPETVYLGHITEIKGVQLGDTVIKVGRTTEKTEGIVEGVDAMITVSYGDAGTAVFDNQLVIRAKSGEFSAGGDSGSAIHRLKDGKYAWCGLLFAGSTDGRTFANRVEDLIAYLPAFMLA